MHHPDDDYAMYLAEREMDRMGRYLDGADRQAEAMSDKIANLQTERTDLIAYARAVEQKYIEALEQISPHRRRNFPKVGPFRAEHGVAHLFTEEAQS